MLLVKEVPDHQRLLLPPVEMTAHAAHERAPVSRPVFAKTVGLYVLVGRFVGVQFRAVARHADEPQPLLVLLHETLHFPGPVHRAPVDDQIDPALILSQQPPEEFNEDPRLELALKHHEGKHPFVGDRQDHVAAETLSGRPDHGRFRPSARSWRR